MTIGDGRVAERLNALVLKTSKGESPSWVQIPPRPPYLPLPQFQDAAKATGQITLANVHLKVSHLFADLRVQQHGG